MALDLPTNWKPNVTRCEKLSTCRVDPNDGWCLICKGYTAPPRPVAVIAWPDEPVQPPPVEGR